MEKNKEEIIPANKVSASPTKKFFVEMLTRDIDLVDAIMDLIDNCIDGVHRETKDKKLKGSSLYNGYHAHIVIDSKQFIISDNCGGIPIEIAKNYAFKMGREEDYHEDDNLQTVGVYGIGMKRAIFKMGLQAEIISYHENELFEVSIPSDWAKTDGWFFDFKKLNKIDVKKILPETGTYLSIKNLYDNIQNRFSDKSGFIKDLREKLQQHYGYIIEQGFEIKLNEQNILPLELNILSDNSKKAGKSIKPYVYRANKDGVSVEVIIGFYRPPAESSEIEEELDGGFAKSSTENAGITVLCNDRVVLYANKDYLTGWGDSPVPSYHTQFINIAGVVHFRSSTPIKLPVTTTKRGLDTSSTIYNTTRNRIKEGLKLFTSFTNYWKASSEQRTKLFKTTNKINALIPGQSKSQIFKLSKRKKDDEGEYQIPDLPKPDDQIKDKFVSISFNREKVKVQKMRDHFFDGLNKSAAEIGGWCFDELYSEIR